MIQLNLLNARGSAHNFVVLKLFKLVELFVRKKKTNRNWLKHHFNPSSVKAFL